ncbi:MAG: RNA polymerase sigma factor [Steroidobacteraceae bacterium]
MPVADDAELAGRALTGDDPAFTQLAGRHKVWLFRFIRRYVGNDDDALDLLQDSLVATWLSLHQYDPGRPFHAWLRQIALNKCRDWTRRNVLRGIVRYVSGDLDLFAADARRSNPEAMLADSQSLRRLDQAIATLPPRLREPLLLTVFEGLSNRETAMQLNASEKAVETRLHRARKRLAKVVEQSDLSLLIEGRTP